MSLQTSFLGQRFPKRQRNKYNSVLIEVSQWLATMDVWLAFKANFSLVSSSISGPSEKGILMEVLEKEKEGLISYIQSENINTVKR